VKNIITSFMLLLLVGCASNQRPAEVVNTPKSSKALPSKSAYYQVKKGDTLASIAKRFAVSQEDILRFNKLKSDAQLVPGQRLLVKDRGGNQQEQKIADDITAKPLDDISASNQSLSDASVPSEEMVTQVPASDAASAASTESIVASPNSGYRSPVAGKIIKDFGKLPDGTVSKGINIAAPKGVPVKSVADGVVKYAGSQAEGYGKLVMIQHGDGKISTYAHLNTIDVKAKSVVSAGSKIGTVGSTGSVSQPQLHLQIRGADKSPIDPRTLISGLG
jgi:murein DD-endopeptidase MepM/ murein hydrolase activator NlpD